MITVIIPCYNSSKTIVRAIHSVLEQTFSVDEIVCIDDCSTDDTVSKVKSIRSDNVKITILTNDVNRGPSFSRNRGISSIDSEFVAFLDADDFWNKQKIEIQMKVRRYLDLDMVGCLFDDTGKQCMGRGVGTRLLNKYNFLVKNQFSTPSVLVKKSVLPLFDTTMKYSEDYNLWLSIVKSHKRVALINKCLVYLDKPSYGHSGLSSNLFRMQVGELKSICNNTSLLERLIFIPYSCLKFVRRIFMVLVRRISL